MPTKESALRFWNDLFGSSNDHGTVKIVGERFVVNISNQWYGDRHEEFEGTQVDWHQKYQIIS